MHTEHEHATTSLKVLLLVFAIVLVGALAYLVWTQNTAPDTTDNSAIVTKKTTTESTTPSTSSTTPPATSTTNGTDSWKTYTSSALGFSVSYPTDWQFTVYTTSTLPASDSTKNCEPGSVGLEKSGSGDLDIFIGVCPTVQIDKEIQSDDYFVGQGALTSGTTNIGGRTLKIYTSTTSGSDKFPVDYFISSFYADKGFKITLATEKANAETASSIVKTIKFTK